MNQPIKDLPPIELEDVEFVYRTNFAGEERPPYDEKGDRYFNAKINPADAEQLTQLGWNVKWTKPGPNHPNPEEHVPEAYIVVNIGYKFRPPTILLIKNINGVDRPTIITEKTLGLLDSAEFTKVDCVIRGRRHEMNGGGYKAWLAEFYGHVTVSNMGSKYAHLLDGGASDPMDDDDGEGR